MTVALDIVLVATATDGMRIRCGFVPLIAVLLSAACGNGTSGSATDGGGDSPRGDTASVDARDRDSGSSDAPSHDAHDASSKEGGGDGGSCPDTGSGKATYSCPSGGTVVEPSGDLGAAVTASKAGDTLCIQGPHRITGPLTPKKGQTWIGVDATASIDGSVILDGWAPASGLPGVWVYSGPLASQMNQDGILSVSTTQTVYACYLVSTYEDDLFYNDQRVMRVLSTAQLTGATLPPGQKITTAETGRFFFDYVNKKIYLTLDPSKAKVELATVSELVAGNGVAGVTLTNLLVEKALTNAIVTGQSWTLTDVTARYAHGGGVEIGAGTESAVTKLERVLTTSNGLYGLAGAGSWVTLEDSEISWNNIANHVRVNAGAAGGCDYMTGSPGGYWGAGGAKLVLATGGSTTLPDLQLLDMQVHDNVGAGFWTDVNDRYVLVQGGRFYRNEWAGYFHEIGCDIEITGIESDHNGTPIKNTGIPGYGIGISDSNNANIHDNILHDNSSAPIVFDLQLAHSGISGMGCVSPPPKSDTDTSNVLKNNRVADNHVYSCAPGARTGMEYGSSESLVSRNNQFVGDAYHVPDTTSTWWADPGPLTWAAWQAVGLDTAGTSGTPCTYTAAPSCGP